MKTLRVVRNIATLFILLVGLLTLWPGAGVLHARDHQGNCCIGSTSGPTNCVFNKQGRCVTVPCSDPLNCSYLQCVHYDGGL